MNNLSYDPFLVLIAVAESRNFSEAANKLQITQPSVSMKLKELERLLPLPLFQLEGKRKVLTHYGRALYHIAKSQVEHFERDLESLHRMYDQEKNLTLRIGGRNEVLDFISSRILFNGRIELINFTSSEAVKRLLSHEIDVAISYERPDSTEIVAKKVFDSSAGFIIHKKFLKGHTLSLDLIGNADFLANTPAIVYHRDGHILKDWLHHIKLDMNEMQVKFVAEDWRVIQHLVESGHGFAMVPDYIQSENKDILRLKIPPKVFRAYTFYALYEKGLGKIKPFKKVIDQL